MVVACIALGVALGGTAYAAVKIPLKSVGRLQLRNGAVGPRQLRTGAVTSTKIAVHAVTATKIARDAVGTDQVVGGGIGAKDLAKGVIPVGVSTVRSASGDPVAPGSSDR